MSHHHDHTHAHDDEHAEAHNHVHDHSDDITPALQNLLYEQLDFSKLTTLNEEVSNSGRAICQKTWAQRLHVEPELQSSTDEQLLMIVPFTGQVRLHSLLIRTSPSASAPRTLKIFVNDDALDFSTAADKPPTQVLSVSQTSEVQEIPVKRVHFNTTRSVALFFEDNWGDGDEEVTRISYLAFKGDFMRLNKEPVSVLYEAAANPADHRAIVGTGVGVGRSVQ
ncbi:PITH domain-containing protein [Massariosphaeria phaeospora]|uniref:PITH domain-containing protein n=1 Tax=Massariosphaeria phaeospora TaxID=100035 RepID=A0A7C8M3B1_9PLEO|nr:PITH domain-containing protein [Massariosphaeria phaeospora]